MSIVKRKHPTENEALAVTSLAPLEWISNINSRGFIEIVAGLGSKPTNYNERSFQEYRSNSIRGAVAIPEQNFGYQDSTGIIHHLDNDLLHCLVAISTTSWGWADKERDSPHPLVRSSLALNKKLLSINNRYFVRLSKDDRSAIVREAAKSHLEKRPMRASNITGVSTAVAELSVAYLTLLEQLYHLSSAQLAVAVQVQELTMSLMTVQRDLTGAISDQLQRMQTYSTRIDETLDSLFPKFQGVNYMLHQLESASNINEHLTSVNNSGVDVVVSGLGSIMADASVEIDQLYRDSDSQINLLGNVDEIDRLLDRGITS